MVYTITDKLTQALYCWSMNWLSGLIKRGKCPAQEHRQHSSCYKRRLKLRFWLSKCFFSLLKDILQNYFPSSFITLPSNIVLSLPDFQPSFRLSSTHSSPPSRFCLLFVSFSASTTAHFLLFLLL